MPAASSTASQFLLEVTTATRLPLVLSFWTKASEDSNTSTPRSLKTSLNSSFLRFPSPQTVSLPGDRSDFPNRRCCRASAGSCPRRRSVACRPRTGSSLSLSRTARRFPLALRHLFQVPVERPLPGGGVHARRICDDPVEVEQPGPVLARGD